LLVLSEEGRLSDGMRFLAARFTQRISYRDNRDGPIFRGRFASVMIKNDAHLVRARVDEPTKASYDAWQVEPMKGGQTRGV